MARKPGSEAMTPPKPYSVAVFIAASSAPATAALLPSAKVLDVARQASRKTSTMPTSSAPSTAQTARIAGTGVGIAWSMASLRS